MKKMIGVAVVDAALLVPAAADATPGWVCSARAGVEDGINAFDGGHGAHLTCATARRVVYRWYDLAYAGWRGCGFKGRTAQCTFRVNNRRWMCASGPDGDGSWRLDCWDPRRRSLAAQVWP